MVDNSNSVMGTDNLMNGILGKLYAVLASGDDVAPASEDNFFAWVTPGQPVLAEDFNFAFQGTSGTILDKEELKRRVIEEINNYKEAKAASGQEKVELDPERIIEKVKKEMIEENVDKLHSMAASFSQNVDFIPDVSGTNESGGNTNLRTMQNEGSLSDVYKDVLQMSQVKVAKLDEETEKKIKKFHKLLAPVTKTTTDITGETKTEILPSPIVKAYNEYMEKYRQACDDYNLKRVNGMYGSVQDKQMWAYGAATYRNRVKAARDEWETSGYKTEYEKISSYIAQVEGRSMLLLLRSYKDLIVECTVDRTNGGASYLYTTLSPSNFAHSTGWTEFRFSSNEMSTYSDSEYHSKSKTFKTSSRSFWHRHSTTNEKSESTYSFGEGMNFKDFWCSFEMCQVNIVRPWFKQSFLTSRYWRFDKNWDKGEYLSDGNMPPKGIMPAFPTSIIFIRNLVLHFGKGSSVDNYMSEYESQSGSSSGGAYFGIFNLGIGGGSLGAGYSHSSTNSESHSDSHYEYDSQSIRVPGMQIIGYNCHIMPKCPNPNPDIKEDEWES